MTCCIAAICERGSTIVCVSDSKLSFGDHSADDIAIKSIPVAGDWRVLFAGNDITGVGYILEEGRRLLAPGHLHTWQVVTDAVRSACATRLHREIEAQVLTPFGISLKEFTNRGRHIFTEGVYGQMCAKITGVKLSDQFLVAGFDEHRVGHVAIVDHESAPHLYDSVGFAAIGTGASSAYSSLLFQANRHRTGIESAMSDCIYCCCEAKFMAESASDVGKETFLTVFRAGEPTLFISSLRIDEIRAAWERYGSPRIPKAISKEIPEMLFTSAQLRAALSEGSKHKGSSRK